MLTPNGVSKFNNLAVYNQMFVTYHQLAKRLYLFAIECSTGYDCHCHPKGYPLPWKS